MPRPTDKAQLLTAMQREHAALEKTLTGLTPEQLTAPSQALGYAVKDILAHLYAWEQLCLEWYAAGLHGQTPALPAPGYNWAQIPALNQQIYKQYCSRPLEEILGLFQASYCQMLATVESIAEADLYTPGHYAWTKKNTLATYFISASSSHYVWAIKEIRKCLKG